MWVYVENGEFERRKRKFQKRHRQETLNALDNVAAFKGALESGLKPQQIIRGFIHNEQHGVLAMDESGPKNPKKVVRVYVYPDEPKCELHVITIGDKDSQTEDVKYCHEYVDSVLAERPWRF